MRKTTAPLKRPRDTIRCPEASWDASRTKSYATVLNRTPEPNPMISPTVRLGMEYLSARNAPNRRVDADSAPQSNAVITGPLQLDATPGRSDPYSCLLAPHTLDATPSAVARLGRWCPT